MHGALKEAYKKFFHVKSIIFLALVAILLLSFLSSLPAIYSAIESYQQARQVQYLNDVGDDLFTAVGNFGFERGRVNVVLNDNGPVEKMEANRRFIQAHRSDGDRALVKALKKLDSMDIPGTTDELFRIKTLEQGIHELREQTGKDLVVPKDQRQAGLAKEWFSAMTAYIETIEALLVTISSDISDADGIISRYSSLKHATLALRNTAGPEISILSATMAANSPMESELSEKIAALHTITLLHFQTLTRLCQPLSSPGISQALAKLKDSYFLNYLPYRNAVLPLAHGGRPYPFSQAEFLDHGVGALKQIAVFMEQIVSETKAYAQTRLTQNKRHILIHCCGAAGSLGMILLIFFYVHFRVIKPILQITSTVHKLANKDLDVAIPLIGKQNEFGEMARALEILKEMAIQLERDIISLRIIDEQLKTSEERFRTVADFSHDWEYWIGPDNQLLYISPSCERITGYTPEDFLKNNNLLAEICTSLDSNEVACHVHGKDIQITPPTSIDFEILGKDGKKHWINHICQPIFKKDGTFLGRRACNRDITDQKKLEEKLINAKKLEATATLMGGIAHDFNNLLASILGNIELAKSNLDVEGKTYSFLQNAYQSTLGARNLTSKFITLSRGGTPIKRPVDIVHFVKKTASSIIAGTGMNLETTLPPCSCKVELDTGQFFQVLDNIITNAREAMPPGGRLKITIDKDAPISPAKDFLPLLPDKQYVKITIEDQGPGIDLTDIDNVFDPYFSTKTRGSGKGMGLGLTVVHSIMEKHGGCTTIKPGKTGGTAVSLYLPALEISLTDRDESNRDITTSA
ncbi:sensory box histidine kinase/response regulator [Desulforapulum autotrophicum HRM2]|uniref:histidine kinase n=1 Tax=Desulforapulum autotrophicum (strain ATCC 43914 / DSM 3382 / VKM B-1955 / HRM2) TaxID=177437 RepID=C0QHC1_DESAH|nr:ATP-binding protein [Desulforapulum autotrophicum]ACN17780.1 sensory box histidine kinase/response regulator [Desulforapulum autotrophicum HRM2]